MNVNATAARAASASTGAGSAEPCRGVGSHPYSRLAAALFGTLAGIGLSGQAAAAELADSSIQVKQGGSDGRSLTATTINRDGTTFDIETATTRDGRGINAFSEFKVKAGHRANLRLPEGAKQLVNLVYDKAVVNGELQSFLNNGSAGGDIIFATQGGFVVGAEGRLNVGSLAVATPDQAFMDGFFDAEGNLQAGQLKDFLAGRFEVAPGSEIDIQGTVNADHAVRLRAGRVTIGGTIDVEDADTASFDASTSDAEAAALFTEAVNLQGLQSGLDLATHNGDVIISSKHETTVESGATLSTAAEGGGILLTSSGTVELAEGVTEAEADSEDDFVITPGVTHVRSGATVKAPHAGVIAVRADIGQARVDGTLQASPDAGQNGDGGRILVGGTAAADSAADDIDTAADETAGTVIGAGALLDASSGDRGDGGEVVIGARLPQAAARSLSDRVSMAGTVDVDAQGGGSEAGGVQMYSLEETRLTAGSRVSASAVAVGEQVPVVRGGEVSVSSLGEVVIEGDSGDDAGARIAADVSGNREGNYGGSVRLGGRSRIVLDAGAWLSAANGQVLLRQSDPLLQGGGSGVNIAGEVAADGAAAGDSAGNVRVRAVADVDLHASAVLSASTHPGGGTGGLVAIDSRNAIRLRDGARIAAQLGGEAPGRPGSRVRLVAGRELALDEGAAVIADNGRILLRTDPDPDPSDAQRPLVRIGGKVMATGSVAGDRGGDIRLWSGGDAELTATALLDASGHQSAGDGGLVSATARHDLTVANGAAIRADAGSTGHGGRIELAGHHRAEIASPQLSARAQAAGYTSGQQVVHESHEIVLGSGSDAWAQRLDTDGGDVTLEAWDRIVLREDAVINTRDTDATDYEDNDTYEFTSTGDSGDVSLEAREIVLEGSGTDDFGRLVGAKILTWADAGHAAGDVELRAIRDRDDSRLGDGGVDITIEAGARIDALAFADDRSIATPIATTDQDGRIESIRFGAARAFSQAEFGGELARGKSGHVLVEASQTHELLAGFADADARVDVNGIIHAGSMVIEADAKAVSANTFDRMGWALFGEGSAVFSDTPEYFSDKNNRWQSLLEFGDEMNETLSVVASMGFLTFLEAKADAEVEVHGEADLVAVSATHPDGGATALEIEAEAHREAGLPGFQSFLQGYFGRMAMDKAIERIFGGTFGLGGVYAGNHGITRAVVESGARVHARQGTLSVDAESINKIKALSFITTTERNSHGGLAIAAAVGKVDTTARIDAGVDLHAGQDLVVDALSANAVSATSVSWPFGQGEIGTALSVNVFDSDTDAYLGSSVGHLTEAGLPDNHVYERTANVEVSALTEIGSNKTYAKVGNGSGAIFGGAFRLWMAAQNNVHKKNAAVQRFNWAYNPREETISKMYNKVFRGATSFGLAFTEQTSNAEIADNVEIGVLGYVDNGDPGAAGPIDTDATQALAGDVAVRGATILTGKGTLKTMAKAGVGAASEHMMAKRDGTWVDNSQVNEVSAALALGLHEMEGTADIGSNVRIAARRIGVTGSSEAEWEPNWDDGWTGQSDEPFWEDFKSGFSSLLGYLETGFGLTSGFFSSYASTSGSATGGGKRDNGDAYNATPAAVGVSVNHFRLDNDARAWVDDGARLYAAEDTQDPGWTKEWTSGSRARTSHVDWQGTVDVRARAVAESVDGGGALSSPTFWGNGASGGVGLGATGIGIVYEQSAIAGVDDGVVIDAAALNVDARIREWHISLAASGGKSNNSGGNGSKDLEPGTELLGLVSVIKLDSRAHASIANTASIRAGDVRVQAIDDKEWVWNVPAALAWGGSRGAGATFAINEIDTDTRAVIGRNDRDDPTDNDGDGVSKADDPRLDDGYGPGDDERWRDKGRVVADTVLVNARNRGQIGGLAVAGTISSAQSDSATGGSDVSRFQLYNHNNRSRNKHKDRWARLWRNTLGLYNPRETGAMYGKDGLRSNPEQNIAGAGALVVNATSLDATALIDGVSLVDRADSSGNPGGADPFDPADNGLQVSVQALGETNAIALSGTAALALGQKKRLLDDGSVLNTGSDNQLAVAGSVAVNATRNSQHAAIVDSALDEVSAVEVAAVDASEHVAVGLSAAIANAPKVQADDERNVSVSANVSVSRIDNRTRSRIKGSRISGLAGPQMPDSSDCADDQRCERFVNVLAQDATRIFSGGFGLSASNNGTVAAGGTVTVNHVTNETDARIVDATLGDPDGDDAYHALDAVTVAATSHGRIIGVGANGAFNRNSKMLEAENYRGAGTGTTVFNVVDNHVRAVMRGSSAGVTRAVNVTVQGADSKPHVPGARDLGDEGMWTLEGDVSLDNPAGTALGGDTDVREVAGEDALSERDVAFDAGGDGMVVVGVAGGLAFTQGGGNAGGVALVVNDVANDYVASIDGDTRIVDTHRRDDAPDNPGSYDNNRLDVTVAAHDRAQLLGIAAGAAVSWKSHSTGSAANAGVGSIVMNLNASDVVARIDRSGIEAARLGVDAVADGRLFGAAGALAIARNSKGNSGAAAGVGFVFNDVAASDDGALDIDGNTIAHGVVARVHDARIDLDAEKSDEAPWVAHVRARSDEALVAVSAGIAVSKQVAVSLSTAVNVVDRATRAEVKSGNAHPFEAASLDVSALHATPEGNGFMLALVLSGALGLDKGAGAGGFTANVYTPETIAEVSGPALAVTRSLQVKARSQTDLYSIATSLAGTKETGAVAVAIAVNVLDSTVRAELAGSEDAPLWLNGTKAAVAPEDFDAGPDEPNKRAGDYSDLRVRVAASDNNRAVVGAIGAAGAGKASGGASVAVNDLAGTVESRVSALSLAGPALPDDQPDALGRARIEDLVVSAESRNRLDAFSIAVGVAKRFGLTGTASANRLGQTVRASVENSSVIAEDDIGVRARADDRANAGAGTLSVAWKGAGVAFGAVANVTDATTEAFVSDSDLSALALDTRDAQGDAAMTPASVRGRGGSDALSGMMTDAKNGDTPTLDPSGFAEIGAARAAESQADIEGLAVTAKRKQDTVAGLVGGAIGAGNPTRGEGWAGAALFTAADGQGATRAYIKGSSINAGTDTMPAGKDQTVHVDAVSDVDRTGFSAGMAGGATVGASVALTSGESHQNTLAWIEGGMVRARDAVTVAARTGHWTRTYTVGVGGGGAALSGAVNLAETDLVTRAFVQSVESLETGTLTIDAHAKADTLQATGNLAIGGGAGGLGLNHDTTTLRTAAFLAGPSGGSPAEVTVQDALVVNADTDLVLRIYALSLSGGTGGGALSGSLAINALDGNTMAFIDESRVRLADLATLSVTAQIDADYDLIAGATAVSADMGAGLGLALGMLTGDLEASAMLVDTGVVGVGDSTPGAVTVSAGRDLDVEAYVVSAGATAAGPLAGGASVLVLDIGGHASTPLTADQNEALDDVHTAIGDTIGDPHGTALSAANAGALAPEPGVADIDIGLSDETAVRAGVYRTDDSMGELQTTHLTVEATDDLRVKAVAGGFGISLGSAGAGASVLATTLSGDVSVVLQDTWVQADRVTLGAKRRDGSQDGEAVESYAIAGAVAGAAALAVGLNYAEVRGDVTARISNSTLQPLTSAPSVDARTVTVNATDSSRVHAENVSVSASLGGSIAAGEVRARKGRASGADEVAVKVEDSWVVGRDVTGDGTLDVFHDRIRITAANKGSVHARGISAAMGGATARGSGVYASDSIAVGATVIDRDGAGQPWRLGGRADTTISAWSRPDVVAVAAGGSVSGSVTVGVSLAQATIRGDVIASLETDIEGAAAVLVEARRGAGEDEAPDRIGAASWAIAADAALLGAANGAEATTEESGDITASLDAAVTGSGATLAVRAQRDTGLVSRTTGVVVGGVALGGAVSETRADGVTRAHVAGHIEQPQSVDVLAENVARTYAHAESGSGGAVAVGVAKAFLKSRQDALAGIAPDTRIRDAGHVRIRANAEARFRAGSDAYQAALAGGGAGAALDADLTPKAEVAIGHGTRIHALGVEIAAESRTRFAARDDLFDDPAIDGERIKQIDNVINTGAGAGLVGIGASEPIVTITPESFVDIGDNVLIKASQNDLIVASHGTVDVRMNGWTVAVGGLAGVPHIGGRLAIEDARHEIDIGDGVTLYAEDMLGVSAMARDMTLSLDNTARAGGVIAAATAKSEVHFDGVERVSVGVDSRLHAYGDLAVTAGRQADRISTLETSDISITALSYTYLFGLPAEGPSVADADLSLDSSVVQGDRSHFIAGRDVAVGAFRGELRQYEYEEVHYLGKRESREGDPTPDASWTTRIDGNVTAGYYSDWTVTTRDDSTKPFDIRLNGNRLKAGWSHEDRGDYLHYAPDFDAHAHIQQLKTALQTDPDADYQATIDYLSGLDLPESVRMYTVRAITATQGNVTIGGTILAGSGTVAANRAEISVSSDVADAWLRVENLRVLNHDGGRIRLANDAVGLGSVELHEDGIGDDGIAEPALIRVSLGTGYSGVDGFDPDRQPALLATGLGRQYGLQNQQGIVSLHNAGGNIYTTTGISAEQLEIRAPGGAYVQIDPGVAQHLGGNPWASWQSSLHPDWQCGSATNDRGMVTGTCSFFSRIFDRMLTGGVIPADYVVALAMKDFLKDKYEDTRDAIEAVWGPGSYMDWEDYVSDDESWLTEELIKQRRVGNGKWVSYTPYNLSGNEFEEWSRSIGPDEYYPEGAYKYIDTRDKDSIWRHVPNFDMEYTLGVDAADYSDRNDSAFQVNDVRILADVINVNSRIEAGFSRNVELELTTGLFEPDSPIVPDSLERTVFDGWDAGGGRKGFAWVWRHAERGLTQAEYEELARAGELRMGWYPEFDEDALPSDPGRVVRATYDPVADELEFGDIVPGRAGSVFLDGKIISTNPAGSISASNGLGNVRIEQKGNHLGQWVSSIVVNDIGSGAVAGEVEIIDRLTNVHTLYRNVREAGAAGIRVYRTTPEDNPGGWESVADWDALANSGRATRAWTTEAEFAPKEGVGYAWRRAYAVHRSIDDKGDDWFYNNEASPWEYGFGKEGQVADRYFTDPGALAGADSGHALVLNTGLAAQEHYRARVVRDRTAVFDWSTRLVDFSDSTVTDKFGSEAYFSAPTRIQVVTEETVRADHAIDIGFRGPAAPSVDILTGAAEVSLAGRIDNPLGDVTIKSHLGGTAGVADLTAGDHALVRAQDLEVRGDGGVGEQDSALTIELHGGALSAASYGEDLDGDGSVADDSRGVFIEARDALEVEFVATDGTPVNVTAEGGIEARNPADLGWTFRGSTVHLDGGHGAIVGGGDGWRMQDGHSARAAGIAASEGVSARVAGDGAIRLFASGERDLRLRRIETDGAVELLSDRAILRAEAGASSRIGNRSAGVDEARWQRHQVTGAAAEGLRASHIAAYKRGVEHDHVRYWRMRDLVESDGQGGWQLRATSDADRGLVSRVYAERAEDAGMSVAAWLGGVLSDTATGLRAYYGLTADASLGDVLPERPEDVTEFRLARLDDDVADPLTRHLVLDEAQLFNAINAAAVDPDAASASWLGQRADIRGSEVSLRAGTDIGTREAYSVQVTRGVKVSEEQRELLLEAAPGSAAITQTSGGYTVDLERVGLLRLDIAGQTRVHAGGMVALADRGDLELAELVADGSHAVADVFVSAEDSIIDAADGGAAAAARLEGALSLRAVKGSIGQPHEATPALAGWNPIDLALGADGRLASAIAGHGVYIEEHVDDLEIGMIAAGLSDAGDVVLRVGEGALRQTQGLEYAVRADSLELEVAGAVGAEGAPLRLALDSRGARSGAVFGRVGGSAWLSAPDHGLSLGDGDGAVDWLDVQGSLVASAGAGIHAPRMDAAGDVTLSSGIGTIALGAAGRRWDTGGTLRIAASGADVEVRDDVYVADSIAVATTGALRVDAGHNGNTYLHAAGGTIDLAASDLRMEAGTAITTNGAADPGSIEGRFSGDAELANVHARGSGLALTAAGTISQVTGETAPIRSAGYLTLESGADGFGIDLRRIEADGAITLRSGKNLRVEEVVGGADQRLEANGGFLEFTRLEAAGNVHASSIGSTLADDLADCADCAGYAIDAGGAIELDVPHASVDLHSARAGDDILLEVGEHLSVSGGLVSTRDNTLVRLGADGAIALHGLVENTSGRVEISGRGSWLRRTGGAIAFGPDALIRAEDVCVRAGDTVGTGENPLRIEHTARGRLWMRAVGDVHVDAPNGTLRPDWVQSHEGDVFLSAAGDVLRAAGGHTDFWRTNVVAAGDIVTDAAGSVDLGAIAARGHIDVTAGGDVYLERYTEAEDWLGAAGHLRIGTVEAGGNITLHNPNLTGWIVGGGAGEDSLPMQLRAGGDVDLGGERLRVDAPLDTARDTVIFEVDAGRDFTFDRIEAGPGRIEARAGRRIDGTASDAPAIDSNGQVFLTAGLERAAVGEPLTVTDYAGTGADEARGVYLDGALHAADQVRLRSGGRIQVTDVLIDPEGELGLTASPSESGAAGPYREGMLRMFAFTQIGFDNLWVEQGATYLWALGSDEGLELDRNVADIRGGDIVTNHEIVAISGYRDQHGPVEGHAMTAALGPEGDRQSVLAAASWWQTGGSHGSPEAGQRRHAGDFWIDEVYSASIPAWEDCTSALEAEACGYYASKFWNYWPDGDGFGNDPFHTAYDRDEFRTAYEADAVAHGFDYMDGIQLLDTGEWRWTQAAGI